MTENTNPDIIIDFISGHSVPNVGAEANRQRVERYLIEEKGFHREDVQVDDPIELVIDGQDYRSVVDLVVRIDGRPLIAFKCAAGSLGSREREIVSAARLFADTPIPLAVVSDGENATVLEVMKGKKVGEGLSAIPDRAQAVDLAKKDLFPPIAPDRLEREKLVFRSYDSMNVNVRKRD